jgi:hypothetical protein
LKNKTKSISKVISKISRRNKIIKVKAEVNEMGMKRIQRTVKQSWFFERMNKDEKQIDMSIKLETKKLTSQ